MSIPHNPVLLQEVLQSFSVPLVVENGGILIDCTVGYGGHSKALLEKYPKLRIIGIDQDEGAIAYTFNHLKDFKDRFEVKLGRFSEVLPNIWRDDIVGILADIGVSSVQFDDKQRGFCFDSHLLDMRMNPHHTLSAKEIVNTYSLPQLERIFRDFGEIREWKKLAHLIVDFRKQEKIVCASALSGLIAKHFKNTKIHPATLAFQALRIEVNDELGELERMLKFLQEKSFQKGARVGIISFHSLEDRIVKTAFKGWERSCICPKEVMKCVCGNNYKKGKNLYKKPLSATKEEIKNNPRSRSAKLRVFEFGN
ncbi:16S rRNA (cytosine(1402)-N(4))-methyltransferase RsmH [Helicobacter mesocricetorum]|uniref:16S rRNA (cytosine(1402)-N(4))-methyltransferase RsmH n=1 Tax=Helicobacter mesocricetorum TaxID=87012 RepID=UPI000CF17875|nr:16S rRNA (cytosine(1402)-N(4))-methyltransferase RsmH [Helicobacter mesocricetorum]